MSMIDIDDTTTSNTEEIGKRFVLWSTPTAEVISNGVMFPGGKIVVDAYASGAISIWESQEHLMDYMSNGGFVTLHWVD